MRITAAQLAKSTWAVLIGVGEYEHCGVEPLAADADVKRVHAGLVEPSACGIPEEQVTTLTGPEATRKAVETELRRLARKVDEDSTLLVYFSGHGYRHEHKFVFHLYDTQPDDTPNTGLSAARLVECLEPCAARGVLVIVDCCVGAGFSETAPEFFFNLGRRDYRIAISASRSDEPSWQLSGDGGSLFTKHLARILQGETAASKRPGEISYHDLVEGLEFAINEDLSRRRPGSPRQQLVANGSFGSIPLLFVVARAAMNGLTVHTGRVSREYLRSILKRSAVAAFLFFVIFFGLYSAWMGSHEYATADAAGTGVYRGYPHMSGFGYPVRLYRLVYNAGDYRTTSPLFENRPLIVQGSGKILDRIHEQLNPVLQAAILAERGQLEEAREFLRQEPGKPPIEADGTVYRIHAAMLRAHLTTEAQIRRLDPRRLRSAPNEVRLHAMLALLELNPARAFAELTSSISQPDPRYKPWDFLHRLSQPCTKEALTYLKALARGQQLHNYSAHLLLAWRTTDCPLSVGDVQALLAGYDFTLTEQVALWAQMQGFSQPDKILLDGSIDFLRRAGFALGWPDLPCQAGWFSAPAPEHPLTRVQLMRHAVRSCPDLAVEAASGPNRAVLSLTQEGEELAGFRVRLPAPLEAVDSREALAFGPALELLSVLRSTEPRSFLLTQILEGEQTLVAEPSLRLARHLGIAWQPGQAFFRGGNHLDFSLEYYLWQHQTHPEEATRIALDRFGEPISAYFEHYFARVGLPQEGLSTIVGAFEERESERTEPAARLLAMFGDKDMLDRLAIHPEPGIRRVLVTHGAFNSQAGAWLDHTSARFMPLLDEVPLNRDLDYVYSTEKELQSLTPEGACWLLDLELERNAVAGYLGERKLLSPGVQLWLEKKRERCGFYLDS